jgi:hypothetical protein
MWLVLFPESLHFIIIKVSLDLFDSLSIHIGASWEILGHEQVKIV